MRSTIVVAVAIMAIAASEAAKQWPTTEPFWPHYPGRKIQVLDGEWSFGYVPNVPDVLALKASDAVTPNTTMVPSCFDVTPPGELGPRGTAFYRTTVDITPNTPIMVYMAACSFYCKVFVDGVEAGEHRASGYQPFWVTAPASPSATREIIVIADNRFNSTTAPTHTGGDFFHYGGITRHVIVHEQPAPTYILQVETFTRADGVSIDMRVVLAGDTADVTHVSIALAWDNATASSPQTYPVTEGVATLTDLAVPDAKPWSIASPNLHTVTVSLNNSADAVTVRFGLRVLSVDADTGRLQINGKVAKLVGYNRHTSYPDTGSALTLAQVQADIAILQQLGAVYVRGAHYPQDQRFLDMCDEAGIVVWEETLGPSVSTYNLTNPYFMQYQLQAVNEMVSASINHPSVILHGFYNEGPSNDPNARKGYAASASAIRARVGNPPTRLVTWASDKKTSDILLDIADVVSFNSYPGWYDHPGNLSQPAVFWESQVDWMRQHYPSKPFTISETGGGGVYEWTNTTDPYWSQKYEAELINADASFAVGNTNISGITLWQFADIKGNDQSTVQCGQCDYAPHPNNLTVPWNCAYINVNCPRPGGENHKGSVDFWRREKQAFAVVQKIYKEVPHN